MVLGVKVEPGEGIRSTKLVLECNEQKRSKAEAADSRKQSRQAVDKIQGQKNKSVMNRRNSARNGSVHTRETRQEAAAGFKYTG